MSDATGAKLTPKTRLRKVAKPHDKRPLHRTRFGGRRGSGPSIPRSRGPRARAGRRGARRPHGARVPSGNWRAMHGRGHPQPRAEQPARPADEPDPRPGGALSRALERRFPVQGRRRQQPLGDDPRVQEPMGPGIDRAADDARRPAEPARGVRLGGRSAEPPERPGVERPHHGRRGAQQGLEVPPGRLCRVPRVSQGQRRGGPLQAVPRDEPGEILAGRQEGARRHGAALPAHPRLPDEGEGADPPRLGLGHAGHEPRLPGLQSRERLLGHLRLRRLRGRVRPELVRLHSSDRRVKETALYIQDSITLKHLTLNLGLRGDLYYGISTARQAEPRVGAAYNFKQTNTVLRFSYARTMETPFNENLVLASNGCNDPVVNAISTAIQGYPCLTSPLSPSTRNEFHAGLGQAFGRWVVVDGEYIWKYTTRAYDFSVFGNTPVTYPIEWARSKIPGYAVRVSVPNFHGFTAFTVF